MTPRVHAIFTLITLSTAFGCAGHFEVRPVVSANKTAPNSSSEAATSTTQQKKVVKGFRYWTPKPYLLITNMAVAPVKADDTPPPDPCASEQDKDKKAACEKQKKPTTPPKPEPEEQADKLVAQIIYLPGEEYTITSRGGGIGTFKGSIQLTNGWMLTGVNQESDAKLAETIEAVATLASKFTGPLAGVTPADADSSSFARMPKPKNKLPIFLLFEIDTATRSLHKVDNTDCLIAAITEQQAGRIPTADHPSPSPELVKACPIQY